MEPGWVRRARIWSRHERIFFMEKKISFFRKKEPRMRAWGNTIPVKQGIHSLPDLWLHGLHCPACHPVVLHVLDRVPELPQRHVSHGYAVQQAKPFPSICSGRTTTTTTATTAGSSRRAQDVAERRVALVEAVLVRGSEPGI